MYLSGISRKMKPIRYVHVFIVCVYRSKRDPGKPMVQFQSKGWQSRDPVDNVDEVQRQSPGDFSLTDGKVILFVLFKASID